MFLGFLMVFYETRQLFVGKDTDFVSTSRTMVEQLRNGPADYTGDPHTTPYYRPAIVSPFNGVSRNPILRDNFGKERDGYRRDDDRYPPLFRLVPKTLYNKREQFAAEDGEYD
jgi:hypothetical protein